MATGAGVVDDQLRAPAATCSRNSLDDADGALCDAEGGARSASNATTSAQQRSERSQRREFMIPSVVGVTRTSRIPIIP